MLRHHVHPTYRLVNDGPTYFVGLLYYALRAVLLAWPLPLAKRVIGPLAALLPLLGFPIALVSSNHLSRGSLLSCGTGLFTSLGHFRIS